MQRSVGAHSVVGMTVIAFAAACVLLAFVPPAQAAVWTALGTTRVFPTTRPGTQHVADLTACGATSSARSP